VVVVVFVVVVRKRRGGLAVSEKFKKKTLFEYRKYYWIL